MAPTRRAVIVGLLAIGGGFATRGNAQTAAASVPRIVFVSNRDEAGARPFLQSFVKGLQERGHAERRTYVLEVRYAGGESSRLRSLIKEGAVSRPDLLVVSGLFSARLARDATATVPIIVATASDLVEAGIVRSYAHPGGNITGIADLSDETSAKRLELLKAALPNATRVALLTNPDFPATPKIEKLVGDAARGLGIRLTVVHATDRPSLLSAVDSLEGSRQDGLLVGGDQNSVNNAKQLIQRATALCVPVAYFWPDTAEMGALFSYQPDIMNNFRRAGLYADRILKGMNPGDLPIELPTRYELVVNLKAARKLGITLPSAFLLRADRVIE
jgi:putative ABC transport system substrate-binding protein